MAGRYVKLKPKKSEIDLELDAILCRSIAFFPLYRNWKICEWKKMEMKVSQLHCAAIPLLKSVTGEKRENPLNRKINLNSCYNIDSCR